MRDNSLSCTRSGVDSQDKRTPAALDRTIGWLEGIIHVGLKVSLHEQRLFHKSTNQQLECYHSAYLSQF